MTSIQNNAFAWPDSILSVLNQTRSIISKLVLFPAMANVITAKSTKTMRQLQESCRKSFFRVCQKWSRRLSKHVEEFCSDLKKTTSWLTCTWTDHPCSKPWKQGRYKWILEENKLHNFPSSSCGLANMRWPPKMSILGSGGHCYLNSNWKLQR